jgi:hypothetical protein
LSKKRSSNKTVFPRHIEEDLTEIKKFTKVEALIQSRDDVKLFPSIFRNITIDEYFLDVLHDNDIKDMTFITSCTEKDWIYFISKSFYTANFKLEVLIGCHEWRVSAILF